MKLSAYARKLGISYVSAWRLWKNKQLDAYQLPTGTIIVIEKKENKLPDKVCIYARVSSSENKNNLNTQAKRLEDYSIARGYQIYKTVKETGSGVNDNRQKLNQILRDKNYNKIVVEHEYRLARFGFNYLKILADEQGKEIEVVNMSENDKDDLMKDFISIITSFCARLYGLRRSKRKTEKIIKVLQDEKSTQ